VKPRVAINGFGRIGRMMFRANLLRDLVDIVAINDLSPAEVHAHLLKFDSTYGEIKNDIKANGKNLVVDGKEIQMFATRDPGELPWKSVGVDVVLEATGAFTDRDGAQKHITAGAKRVLITAPAKNPDATFVIGVNDQDFDTKKHFIVSNASCTTNCLAPLAKILDEAFGIEKGFMTTIHSYTNDQKILDLAHKDLRRARAAGLSLIPTSTGAAKAIGEVLPHLKGKLDGISVRAPTPTVSLVDLAINVTRPPKDAKEVNEILRKAAATSALKGIFAVEDRPLVSIDFKHNSHSSIVDSALTMVNGNMIKVFSWYDNEWGYSMRTIELAAKIGA
jgi:glyceraldehyde 3-phosphate dehydrogenase